MASRIPPDRPHHGHAAAPDHGHDHGHGHGHGPGHDHDHGHADDHDHDHDPAHAPASAHGHAGHDPAHGHGHHAHLPADSSNLRLGLALSLNLVFVALECGFGLLANSVALIADAGHNLGDALGLAFAWAALHLSRRPPGGRFTYGLGRSSVLAALSNAVLLLLACGAIAWEAVGRIAAPPAVAGSTVAAVAACGIVLNGLSAWLLHAGSEHDLNRRSAFLHMLADAGVSAGVLLSGLAIALTGLRWIDPVVSLLIVVIVLIGTFGLLRDAVHLSLDAVPAGVDSSAVLAFLRGQRGVTDVHDLHIWALSTTSVALTAHLVVPEAGSADALISSLTPSLKRRFHIDHATLQIERDRCDHGCAA